MTPAELAAIRARYPNNWKIVHDSETTHELLQMYVDMIALLAAR